MQGQNCPHREGLLAASGTIQRHHPGTLRAPKSRGHVNPALQAHHARHGAAHGVKMISPGWESPCGCRGRGQWSWSASHSSSSLHCGGPGSCASSPAQDMVPGEQPHSGHPPQPMWAGGKHPLGKQELTNIPLLLSLLLSTNLDFNCKAGSEAPWLQPGRML